MKDRHIDAIVGMVVLALAVIGAIGGWAMFGFLIGAF